ncbi:MAG: hypothetical protein U9R27_06465 [Campylobacterota bacterium]|nr:hypothetical protein [Campylobacterota bacterium]
MNKDTKRKLQEEIKYFQSYHANSIKNIEFLVSNIVKDQKKTCIALTDCDLYKWLEENKILLNQVFGPGGIGYLYDEHKEWHIESEKICTILANDTPKGFTAKLFGKKRKITPEEMDKVKFHLYELQEHTKQINNRFVKMERRINAIPDDS